MMLNIISSSQLLYMVIGITFGGLVGWRLARRNGSPEPSALDPVLEQRIDAAAAQWAAAHDRPGAAPLIADKLRLAYVLSQRPRRRRGRWSR
jgi:hypothetical protein